MNRDLTQKIHTFLNNIRQPEYIVQQIAEMDTDPISMVGINCLENLGNTCYLGAVLQCLRHTTPLNCYLVTQHTQAILSRNFERTPKLGSQILLLLNYLKIAHMLSNIENAKLSPISFKLLIGDAFSQFANNQQHDADELLCTILQSFHDVLSKNVKYRIEGEIYTEDDVHIKKAHEDWISYYNNRSSVILDIFSGQLRTGFQCLDCHKILYRFDPIMIIDLPIVPNTHIYQLFDHLVEMEQLSDDNLYECDDCHHRTKAHKRTMLWKLPKILIVKLNRFRHQIINGQYQSIKIDGLIDYPLDNLDLTKYLANPDKTQVLYKLYAVICHLGGMNCGHYYAIVHNKNTNQWIKYNDTHVSLNETPISNDAYLLLYESY